MTIIQKGIQNHERKNGLVHLTWLLPTSRSELFPPAYMLPQQKNIKLHVLLSFCSPYTI